MWLSSHFALAIHKIEEIALLSANMVRQKELKENWNIIWVVVSVSPCCVVIECDLWADRICPRRRCKRKGRFDMSERGNRCALNYHRATSYRSYCIKARFAMHRRSSTSKFWRMHPLHSRCGCTNVDIVVFKAGDSEVHCQMTDVTILHFVFP